MEEKKGREGGDRSKVGQEEEEDEGERGNKGVDFLLPSMRNRCMHKNN